MLSTPTGLLTTHSSIHSKALSPVLSQLEHSRPPQAVVTQGKSCWMVLSFAISTCCAPSKHPEANSIGLDDTWHILVLFSLFTRVNSLYGEVEIPE